MSPQPNPIKQSTVPGQAIGDYSSPNPPVTPGATRVSAVAGSPAWQPNTIYVANQVVTNGGNTYLCLQEYQSSSSFSADFTAGYWAQIGGGSGGGTLSGDVNGPATSNVVDNVNGVPISAGQAGYLAGLAPIGAPRTLAQPSDTVLSTDLGKRVKSTSAAAATLIIPQGLGNVGDQLEVFQYGAGPLQVVGAGSAILLSAGDSASNGGSNALVPSGSACKPFPAGLGGGAGVALIGIRPNNGGVTGTPDVSAFAGYGGTWFRGGNFWDATSGDGGEVWFGTGITTDNVGLTPTLAAGHSSYLLFGTLWSVVGGTVQVVAGTGGLLTAGAAFAFSPTVMGSAAMWLLNTGAAEGSLVKNFPASNWATWDQNAFSINNYGLLAAYTSGGNANVATVSEASGTDRFGMIGLRLTPTPTVQILSPGGYSRTGGQFATAGLVQDSADAWVLAGDIAA